MPSAKGKLSYTVSQQNSRSLHGATHFTTKSSIFFSQLQWTKVTKPKREIFSLMSSLRGVQIWEIYPWVLVIWNALITKNTWLWARKQSGLIRQMLCVFNLLKDYTCKSKRFLNTALLRSAWVQRMFTSAIGNQSNANQVLTLTCDVTCLLRSKLCSFLVCVCFSHVFYQSFLGL